ncbi:MAG: hypothetical protein UW30_C0002G0063 [Candidatus Giovannonibacteria bacterium GW2011_GWA2_44_13b]|uniref:Uncharacterized protein n=2 Tax=Candidatus Giovannoniibacteriota TaxID=1752738 RepID=A0A0G1JDU1_9BACT|nr:MAG: hypothetical protein UW30_C0002G0063 [Candidatus Giovannonibacteria bacterium GW2011_GWA2_44_13b]OGF81620.1 MAG: hypothetical protein A2924_02665 [Candidatus Giovannonibacteria bacterium RIFCSPLOWO2_01_FULL_44_16]
MLALYEISINKVAKKILFVDLGDVLIKFEEKYVRELIKEEKFGDFISMIHDHDRGNPDFELFGMHQKLIFGNYFKRPVPWKELAQAYWNCIGGVHAPMFKALQGLKKRGIKLVCLTDNNHFCFYSTTVKFPEVCDLFHENGRDMWMLSYKFGTLKKDWNGSLFAHLPGRFGVPIKDAAFVDNMPINIESAVKAGFKKNSVFLYDRLDPKNHERFLKFLDKQFPS